MNKFENLYENYGNLYSTQKRAQQEINNLKEINDNKFFEENETFGPSLDSALEPFIGNLKDLINTDFADSNSRLKAFLVAKRYIHKVLKDERL